MAAQDPQGKEGIFFYLEDGKKLRKYINELWGTIKESDKIIDRANDLLAK